MSFSNVKKKVENRRPISYRQSRAGLLAEALSRKQNSETPTPKIEHATQEIASAPIQAKVEQAEITADFRFDFAVPKKEEKKVVAYQIPGSDSSEVVIPAGNEASLVNVGTPQELINKLSTVGYQCLPFFAAQIALLLNTPSSRVRALLLEGPSGCGKSYMAKSLAKITGAELMCLSCYKGMPTQNLIESPSTLALANAMTGKSEGSAEELMNIGILSRAYLKSQEKPVILLIDELDKPDAAIDTFFLGPIQDSRIWLESRAPIDAKVDNLLIIFTKNFNRVIDDALLRRCHPVKMTYLDSTLEKKILSPHCDPILVANLVAVADRMRNSGGSYAFERPPAPEELLATGHYVQQLISWGITDFGFVGKSIWAMVSKSEHDRAVLEHMLRFHPDFTDPLIPDARYVPIDTIHSKLGRLVLQGLVEDPESIARKERIKQMEENDEF